MIPNYTWMGGFINVTSFSVSNTVQYGGFATGATPNAGTTNETTIRIRQRAAGTYDRMGFRVSANTRTNAATLRFRKNNANGNQVVTVGAGLTGWFEDTTNTDTVAVDDYCAYSLSVSGGSGSISIRTYGIRFLASDGATKLMYGWSQQGDGFYWGTGAASSTRYVALFRGMSGSWANGSTTTEGSGSSQGMTDWFKTPGVLSGFRIYVTTNPAPSVTSVAIYDAVSASLRNQGIAVPGSTTGEFIDTTNTDTVAADDKLCVRVVLPSDTGNYFRLNGVACLFESDVPGQFDTFSGCGSTISFQADEVFYRVMGAAVASSVEEAAEMKAPFDMYISKMRAKVYNATSDTSVPLTLRVDGVNTALGIAATNHLNFQYYEDAADEIFVPEGSTLSIRKPAQSGTGLRVEFLSFTVRKGAAPDPGGGGAAGKRRLIPWVGG